MKKRGKKGQISLFIIMGIVIMIFAGIMLYVNYKDFQKRGEVMVQDDLNIIYDSKETELVQFVHSCLDPITLRGLEIIRLQGGYIEIPNNLEYVEVVDKENYRYVDESTGKKLIKVDPTGQRKNKVPYWLTPSPNSKIIIPPIEKELETFINEELKDCVGNFEPFTENGFTVEAGDVDTEVIFADQVIIDVNFPINVKKDDLDYTTERYIYKVPIQIGLIRELGVNVLMNEIVNNYLEKTAMRVVSLYSGIDRTLLPPISGADTGFKCNEVTWQKTTVKEQLKGLIDMNWYFIHVNNTRFLRHKSTDQASQAFFDSLIFNMWNKTAPLITVDFRYEQDWDFDLDIFPSSRGTIKPVKTKVTMLVLPVQCYMDYDFYYDMEFPTLVKIHDLESAKIAESTNYFIPYQGYKFSFPVDTRVCGNHPKNCNMPTIDDSGPGLQDIEINKSYFCDEENMDSELITINLTELYSGNPATEFTVDYKCGTDANRCYLGNTNSQGLLSSQLPECENGQLVFDKYLFTEMKQPLTINKDTPEQQLDYVIEERKPINITIKVVDTKEYAKLIYEKHTFDPTPIEKTILKKEVLANINNKFDYNQVLFYPEKRGINITSGEYTYNLLAKTNITVFNKSVSNRKEGGTQLLSLNKTGKTYKGDYVFLSVPNKNLSVPLLHNKSEIIFRELIEFWPRANMTADEILDPIIQGNGSLGFEVWTQYRMTGREPLSQVKINKPWLGIYSPLTWEWVRKAICEDNETTDVINRDYSGGTMLNLWGNMDLNCTKVYDVYIPYENYSKYFEPKII